MYKRQVLEESYKLYGSTGAREKAGNIMYAMGITQFTHGSQNVRACAMVQLLLGNMGIPGGGVNAQRGQSNVQGSTDMAIPVSYTHLDVYKRQAWWSVVLAAFFAVGIAKELMGGLGWNRFNPALFGLAAITLLAPVYVGSTAPFGALRQFFGPLDVITQATPLALLKQGMLDQLSLSGLFIASPGGALGETSAIALIIGGVYLLYKQHIRWQIPVSMIVTVLVVAVFWGDPLENIAAGIPLYHVLAGGLLLGAFFMATDWVTSPITSKGEVIFGIAIGILVMLFRKAFGPTEGVAFSILIMNAFVPLIDRLTRRPKFGELPVERAAAVPAGPPVTKSN